LYVFCFYFALSESIVAAYLARNPRTSHEKMARFTVVHFFLLKVQRCSKLQLQETC